MGYSSISFCPGLIPFCPCMIPFCPCSIPFCPIVSSRYAFLYIPFCPCCSLYRSMLYPVLPQMCPVTSQTCLVLPPQLSLYPRFTIKQRFWKQLSFYISFTYLSHFYNDYTWPSTHRLVCIYLFIKISPDTCMTRYKKWIVQIVSVRHSYRKTL